MSTPETATENDPGTDPRADPGDGLGYEAAREQLVETVSRLESGGTTLEESLALWERAESLARTCQAWLDGARRRLDTVVDEDGADEDQAG